MSASDVNFLWATGGYFVGGLLGYALGLFARWYGPIRFFLPNTATSIIGAIRESDEIARKFEERA